MKPTGKQTYSSRAIRIASTAILLTAGISLIRLAFNVGYYYKAFECDSSPDLTCAVTFEGSFIVGATVGLCLAAIGLWSRRFVGYLLSLIGLLWLVSVYIMWYLGTFSVLEMAEVPRFSQLPKQPQYLLPLIEATWWDVAVLVIALLVLLWQVANFVQILKPMANFVQILKPTQSEPKIQSDERVLSADYTDYADLKMAKTWKGQGKRETLSCPRSNRRSNPIA